MIRNIWAVGRNYGEHAKELGHAVPEASSEPMIFLKAGSTIVENGASFSLPEFSNDVHHECEVALRFGKGLHFDQIAVALDLTARDIQNKLKAASHPWTLAKSFKAACPIGKLTDIPKGLDLSGLTFTLHVNGELRQKGETRDMIHGIEKLRNYVVSRFPVCEGDLLLTGTPPGVAKLAPGDRLKAQIQGFPEANWTLNP